MWRAVGRPPCPAFGHGAIGLCACRRAAPLLASQGFARREVLAWPLPRPRGATSRVSARAIFCEHAQATESSWSGRQADPCEQKGSQMPIIVILLIAALVATFGFWGALKGILGAIGVIVLLCLLAVLTVSFLAAWLLKR